MAASGMKWLGYFVLAIAFQWLGGAYRAGFDGHPDEAAHVVTGLMVRDYLAQGLPSAPLEFAGNYYIHYPQVAFGHWPPAFYVLQAVWTLVFPVSRASLLWLMAVCTAAAAAALHSAARTWLSPAAGLFCGLLFVALPLTREFGGMVMAEIPLALFIFLALRELVDVHERARLGSAVRFGLFAVVAILTKGSGWMLLLLPVLSAALLRPPRRVIGGLALSMILMVVLAAPFYVLTLPMARLGMEGRSLTWPWLMNALGQHAAGLWQGLGPVVLAVFVLGLIGTVWVPLRRHALEPRWTVLASSIVATVALNIGSLTWVESRKLLPLIPAALLLAGAGLLWLASLTRLAILPIGTRVPILGAAILLAVAVQGLAMSRLPSTGMADAADFVSARADAGDGATLVASTVAGAEGGFIARTAIRDAHRPGRFVLRASKLLASSTWNNLDYRELHPTAAAMRSALESVPVGFLVVQTGEVQLRHEQTLGEMLRLYRSEWEAIYSRDAPGGRIDIYRRTQSLQDRPIRIQLDLTDSLGKVLKYGY